MQLQKYKLDMRYSRRWEPIAAVHIMLLIGFVIYYIIAGAVTLVHNNNVDDKRNAAANLTKTNAALTLLLNGGNIKPWGSLGRLSQDLTPLLISLKPEWKSDSVLPNSVINIAENTNKYDGASKYMTYCLFQQDNNGNCQDSGPISDQFQGALQAGLGGYSFKPVVVTTHTIDLARDTAEAFLYLLLADWLFLLVYMTCFKFQQQELKGFDLMDNNLDHDSNLTRGWTLATCPPLFTLLCYLHFNKAWYDSDFRKNRLAMRVGKDTQFAQELKDALKLQKELADMAPSQEHTLAQEHIRQTIDILRHVPDQIKKDEDRIKAVRLARESSRLRIGAETIAEAHVEMMQEYHEPQIKNDLEELRRMNTRAITQGQADAAEAKKHAMQFDKSVGAYVKCKCAECLIGPKVS